MSLELDPQQESSRCVPGQAQLQGLQAAARMAWLLCDGGPVWLQHAIA
jgi:hypothetical protein